MDKNDTVRFVSVYCGTGPETRHGERKISAGMRMPGRGIPENDQRQIQAADHLGSAGRPPALWRNPQRAAERRERQFGNSSPRAQPRVEGARREWPDRPE